MPKANSISVMTQEAMTELRVGSARGVPGGPAGRGRPQDELAKRFRHQVRKVMTDERILRLIEERVARELEGQQEVKITPTLMKIAAGLYYQKQETPSSPTQNSQFNIHLHQLSDRQLLDLAERGVRPA